jgi:Uma2 family endonuclease
MTTIPDTAATVVRASHVLGPAQGHWTYAAYAQLPEPDGFRYEVVAGVLYMAPAPIPDHERIVMMIGARLVAAIEDTGLGRVFASPNIDVGGSTVRPDTVVVLNTNLGIIGSNRLIGPPDLVVEVTSPSTAAYDRDLVDGKRGAYARIGIPEYWIVDLQTRHIEVCVLTEGSYVLLGNWHGEERLQSIVLPEFDYPVQMLFPRSA